MNQETAKATIQKDILRGKQVISSESSEEFWPVTDLPDNPSYVGINAGVTKNLGNFESARLDVTLKVPSGNTLQQLNETFDGVREWTESKLKSLIVDAIDGPSL